MPKQTLPFFFTCLFTLLSLSSCSTFEKKYTVYKAQRILVLPTQVGHEELYQFEGEASKALEKRLRKKGFETLSLSLSTYNAAHEIALEKTGSIYEPSLGKFAPLNKADYAKEMMYLLMKKKSFDLIVFPSIILRQAEVDKEKGTATFDNLTAPITFDDSVRDKVYPDVARGLSFKLIAMTRDKLTTQPVIQGIALPFDVKEEAGLMGLSLKTQLISDKELQVAVDKASKQFLKQVERP